VAAPTLHRQRLPPRSTAHVDLVIDRPASDVADGVMLCSPQPLLGGDRDNNVLAALAAALAADLATIRFDYRGVGASHDVVPGLSRYEYWLRIDASREHAAVLEDAREALVRTRRLCDVVALGGYSFGAYVALCLAAEVDRTLPLVLIAPPIGRFEFDALADHRGATLLVTAGRDTLDPPPPIAELRARFPRIEVQEIATADHFFRGHEPAIGAAARQFLARKLDPTWSAPR
jgi:uncharacterized protein